MSTVLIEKHSTPYINLVFDKFPLHRHKKSSFIRHGLLKPIPIFVFGWQQTSQFTRWALSALLLSISLKKPTLNFLCLITNGFRNLCILHVVIRNIYNNWLRQSNYFYHTKNYCFHLASLFWIFRVMWLKLPPINLLVAIFAPMYLHILVTWEKLVYYKISPRRWLSTFLKKKIRVFRLLFFWLEAW